MRTSRTPRHLVCVECDSAALGIFLFNGNNFTGSAALADVCALLSINLFGLLYSEVMTLTLALFLASGVGWATRMPRTSPPTCRSVYRLSDVRAVFFGTFSPNAVSFPHLTTIKYCGTSVCSLCLFPLIVARLTHYIRRYDFLRSTLPKTRCESKTHTMKKAPRETQTLRAGCSRRSQNFSPRRRPPSRGRIYTAKI